MSLIEGNSSRRSLESELVREGNEQESGENCVELTSDRHRSQVREQVELY